MKVLKLLKRYGVKGFIIKAEEKLNNSIDREYQAHYSEYLPTDEELLKQSRSVFDYAPLISIVVPAYNTNSDMFRRLLDSVKNQSYANWQLIIADASDNDGVCTMAETFSREIGEIFSGNIGDSQIGHTEKCIGSNGSWRRVIYKRLAVNRGISENTNEGLKLADGDYIALLDHDDELTLNALYENVRAMNSCGESRPVMLYSDEDKTDENSGTFFAPHFKQDFNRELLNNYNYVCHFLVFSREALEMAGGLNEEFDGSQDHDYVLRVVENFDASRIYHIRKILYHWRVHNGSTAGFADNKSYAYNAGINAVTAHFERMGMPEVKAVSVRGNEYYRVARNYLIKDDKVIALCNPNIEAEADWKDRLSQYFGDRDFPIGIVGGKLTKNGRVVSCGYLKDDQGNVTPVCRGIKACLRGNYWLAAVSRDADVVSLDFCVIDKEALEAVGGLDDSLKGMDKAANLCDRMKKAGYRVVVDGTVTGRYGKEFLAE